ncbi:MULTISPECIES: hypothetical protein [Nitrosomonas]|uniref:Uncharacterized protein n=1 Tax=Nitrosomonas communis TaxID=44574 RepID=A0A0F7KB48_9PROT|nr:MULTISPECIES: hypothetical protein [Nitrosomonas]AKH37610.1 hypothetical protein AAW31_06935 [Nitrosomonas communis]TYP72996.1 hypothetical protein BCL69_10984 [Nitrosomonas communis]UVS62883.1 hypothetical protein NX761_07210 [Nitrosomonas sp. PLL12]
MTVVDIARCGFHPQQFALAIDDQVQFLPIKPTYAGLLLYGKTRCSSWTQTDLPKATGQIPFDAFLMSNSRYLLYLLANLQQEFVTTPVSLSS